MRNAYARAQDLHLAFICQLDKSRDVMKLARSMSQQKPIKHTEAKTVKESRSILSSRHF